ncbi:hypothetical protein V6N11_073669 [Hibiscus sabdariffa]|uniref:Uncharacterized protein n=1 Tax=Hibiscus sabdariffa TaxID=183260 RepID=A0ABR2NTZ1_9ROSI
MGLPSLSPDEVISIQSDDLILEAFKRMRDNQVGAWQLQLTVKDFISTVVSTDQEFGRPTSPVTCRVDSTLGSVTQSLATKKTRKKKRCNSILQPLQALSREAKIEAEGSVSSCIGSLASSSFPHLIQNINDATRMLKIRAN